MLDAQNAVAAPAAVRREDYRPPDWLVPEISLDFDLGPERTSVRATLQVARNGSHRAPLRLNGDALTPASVTVDGAAASSWMDGDDLVLDLAGDSHSVEIAT